MRRLVLRAAPAVMAIGLLLAAPGCKRRQRSPVETVEEDSTQLVSLVHTADPKTAVQLLRGFHEVEQNAWRWTKAQFSVTLKTPPDARTKGATLELKMTLPDPVISHVKTTTLSATVNGTALAPETYSKTGEHVYTRTVPAASLQSEAVTVDFSFDKYLGAGQVEERELAAIVSSVGLLSQ
jgi:hypothetical protein